MNHEYFQFGGFNPQIQWRSSTYDDKLLAESIGNPSSPLRARDPKGVLEVILGIKRSGSSHLLLTVNETRDVASAMRLALPRFPPLRAREFESLSPITFSGVEDLAKKLATLKPKAGKGRQGDTSQANRGYDGSQIDLYRGAFEHGRLFYRILHNSIDATKYGIDDTLWVQKVRVCSFVFNVKGVDDRHSTEKKRFPAVLDIGFCEARLPDLMPDYGTAKHVMNAQNALLGRQEPRRPFSYGNSEKMPQAILSQRIQDFFKGTSSEAPMILLISKKEETINYLTNMGIDTSGWLDGIRDLMMSDAQSSPSRSRDPRRYGGSSSSRESTYPQRSNVDGLDYGIPSDPRRSRSRSPGRRGQDTLPQRRSSPTATASRKKYAPVYYLDVYELYSKLMQANDAPGIVDIARSFKLTDEHGWCAGNESSMIIDIWRSMVSSLPIDEQRALRTAALHPSSAASGPSEASNPSAGAQPETLDSDDEQDPNDIVALPVATIQSTKEDIYNLSESDYTDDE